MANKLSFTLGEVDALLQTLAGGYAAPRNLLVNSNFKYPVNQRGLTSYPSGSRRYTLDRWAATATVKVTVNSSSVTVENTSASTSGSFIQYFDEPPAAGDSVTVACKTADGSVYSGVKTMPASGTVSVFQSPNGWSFVLAAANDTYPARVYAYFPGTGAAELEWVAVYNGSYTAENIPGYRAEDPALALSACKYDFERISATGNNLTIGIGSGTASVLYVPIRLAPKRATPAAFPAEQIAKLRYGTNALGSTPTNARIYSADNASGFYTLELTGSFTAGTFYRVGLLAGGVLDFDSGK